MISLDPSVYLSQYPGGQDPPLEVIPQRTTRIIEDVEFLKVRVTRIDFTKLKTTIKKLLNNFLLHSRNTTKDKTFSINF